MANCLNHTPNKWWCYGLRLAVSYVALCATVLLFFFRYWGESSGPSRGSTACWQLSSESAPEYCPKFITATSHPVNYTSKGKALIYSITNSKHVVVVTSMTSSWCSLPSSVWSRGWRPWWMRWESWCQQSASVREPGGCWGRVQGPSCSALKLELCWPRTTSLVSLTPLSYITHIQLKTLSLKLRGTTPSVAKNVHCNNMRTN